jgi:hypothetical protein
MVHRILEYRIEKMEFLHADCVGLLKTWDSLELLTTSVAIWRSNTAVRRHVQVVSLVRSLVWVREYVQAQNNRYALFVQNKINIIIRVNKLKVLYLPFLLTVLATPRYIFSFILILWHIYSRQEPWSQQRQPLLGNRFVTCNNGVTGKWCSLRGPCDSYVMPQWNSCKTCFLCGPCPDVLCRTNLDFS